MGLLDRLGLPLLPAASAASIAAGDITDAGITGEALVQAETPAEARAELADATTFTFASATGVTLNNGTVGGSAAVTGGVLRLTVPASPQARYVASLLEAPRADVAVLDSAGRRPLRWRARVRLAACAAGTVAYLLAVSSGGSHRVATFAGPDGSGGAENNVAVSSYGTFAAAALPTNGTGWLEVEVDGHFGIYRYGTGTTTTPPTTWTEIATAALPSAGAYTTLRLVGASYADPGTPSSVDFDNLTIEAL